MTQDMEKSQIGAQERRMYKKDAKVDLNAVKPPVRPRVQVPSRYDKYDKLEETLGHRSTLTEFRKAVLCRHTNNRSTTRKAIPAAANQLVHERPFLPTNPSQARSSLKSSIVLSPREPAMENTQQDDAQKRQKPRWNGTSIMGAKNDISIKYYFNSPGEAEIKADREYTRRAIAKKVQEYHLKQ